MEALTRSEPPVKYFLVSMPRGFCFGAPSLCSIAFGSRWRPFDDIRVKPISHIRQYCGEQLIVVSVTELIWSPQRPAVVRIVGVELERRADVHLRWDDFDRLPPQNRLEDVSDGRIGRSWIAHGTVARVGARPHRRRTGDFHFDRVAFHSFELFLFLSVSDGLLEGFEVGLDRGAGVGGLMTGIEGFVGFSDGDGRGLGEAERHGVHVLSCHEYRRNAGRKQAPDEFVKIRTKTRKKANECEISTANCKCAGGDTEEKEVPARRGR